MSRSDVYRIILMLFVIGMTGWAFLYVLEAARNALGGLA